MTSSSPLTIEQVDVALQEILGPSLEGYRRDGSLARTLAMTRAAEVCFVRERPEDEHSRALRAGLRNLSRYGTIEAPQENAR